MKKTLLFAAILTAITTATTITPAAAQSGDNQMSIRVAGYEVLLRGDDTDNTDDTAAKGHERGMQRGPNWRRNQRFPGYYSGRIGFLEVGVPNLRTWGDSYAIYPDSEKGFMTPDLWKTDYVAFNISTISSALTRSGWLGATLAMGVAYNQFGLDQPVALTKVDHMLHPVAPDAPLKKSKIRSWWLHAPLVFEINPNRHFFISAGGYVDLLFWSSAKWKSPKQKLSNPYLNPIQLGLTARVGFREVYFFGNYALTDYFLKDKGPRLNQFTIGLGLNL
jgi:hypothetical protein